MSTQAASSVRAPDAAGLDALARQEALVAAEIERAERTVARIRRTIDTALSSGSRRPGVDVGAGQRARR